MEIIKEKIPQRIQNPSGNPSEPLPKRLFSLKEAAGYLGITLWAMRSLVWAGKIRYIKIGKKYFVDRSDLDGFIEKSKLIFH